MKKYLLVVVILLTAYFRFNNLNWDSGFHLHPDERFLTMVGGAMKLPKSFIDYLDPQTSPMNPTNVGFPFFVYGAFPVILNKLIAVLLQNNSYNTFTLQGRFLSALADLFVVFLVYKTMKLLFYTSSTEAVKHGALWGTFLYAISTLPIQLSHFFTVDSFLNFFMFASFYFMLRYGHSGGRWTDFVLSALFLGFGISSKITALFILPLVLFLLFAGSKRKYLHSLLLTTCYLLLIYLFVRISNPYYFESAHVFDFRLGKTFLESLSTLKSLEGSAVWYPPGVQWIGKTPVIFSLVNLAMFGVGTPYFILIVIGAVKLISKFKVQRSKRNLELLGILIWIFVFFFYQSTQFVKNMRYFIFIYPFLAIVGAMGGLGGRVKRLGKTLFVGAMLVWPLMFSTIYLRKHSRVEASKWIYRNLPSGSVILGEYWDDPLPLPVEKTYAKNFHIELLPVFDQDTEEKWKKMNSLLKKADYYILSSNRGWGSILDTPSKYPVMSRFYKDLFNNKTSFRKIKEFTAYPELKIKNLKLEINDQWADESFTVYDHPKVIIFRKQK